MRPPLPLSLSLSLSLSCLSPSLSADPLSLHPSLARTLARTLARPLACRLARTLLGPSDDVLTHSSLARSIDAITAHGSYWSDVRFSTFVLTQLFSDPQRLEENGREQVGIEEEDEPHET